MAIGNGKLTGIPFLPGPRKQVDCETAPACTCPHHEVLAPSSVEGFFALVPTLNGAPGPFNRTPMKFPCFDVG